MHPEPQISQIVEYLINELGDEFCPVFEKYVTASNDFRFVQFKGQKREKLWNYDPHFIKAVETFIEDTKDDIFEGFRIRAIDALQN